MSSLNTFQLEFAPELFLEERKSLKPTVSIHLRILFHNHHNRSAAKASPPLGHWILTTMESWFLEIIALGQKRYFFIFQI